MPFRVDALTPDGNELVTVRTRPENALSIAERWLAQGFQAVAIRDFAGRAYTIDEFREDHPGRDRRPHA